MPVPDFLLTEESIDIPAGVAFAPSGFIGQWVATVYHSFLSEMDFPKEEYGWDKRRETSAGSFWYYFKSQAKAVTAYEETGGSYSPSSTWEWMAKSETILNWRGEMDISEVFGPSISRESAVRTLRSKKQRHELHMLSLPAAVAAMATAYGYDHPGFPLTELLKPEEDILWTDDFQREMIGNADVGYTDSILWKRREALFAALDEPNARNWRPEDTKSQKLRHCLSILHSPWKSPIWAKVLFIWDPRVDATYQSNGVTRRLTRPVLLNIFSSREEAQKAAEEDMGGEKTTGSKKATAGSQEPPLPDGYEEFHDEWVEAVREIKEEYGGLPPLPVLKRDRVLENLACTVNDLKAWMEVV